MMRKVYLTHIFICTTSYSQQQIELNCPLMLHTREREETVQIAKYLLFTLNYYFYYIKESKEKKKNDYLFCIFLPKHKKQS